MIEKLFVYGTLAPNRPNEHILKNIGGSWENATIRGELKQKGWGAKMGYPGIDLTKNTEDIEGFIFTSSHLSTQWKMLDDFEGEGYKRVITQATLKNGNRIDVFVYTLT